MAGKGDVINSIAEQAGISKKEANAAYDAFIGYITESCGAGERCAIPGLGSFQCPTAKPAKDAIQERTRRSPSRPAGTSDSKQVRI